LERVSIAERGLWSSRFAFIMAAIGSAVGLGNVWRFPYVCYDNGGGAFLIPYFVALFTAGIPLMILEFSLGHWSRKAPPMAFREVSERWEWMGWWSVLIPFVVATYYVVVMSWCFAYMVYSIDLRWGSQAENFFLHSFLGVTGDPLVFGGIRIPVLLGLVAVWVSIFLILYKGVERIGRVVALTVPLPTILLVILTIRGLTLPGAMDGISYYLTPDFPKLLDSSVWIAAYAQVFFSLSLAQGIMITYASFLPRDSDISNNAFITALSDAGTSFFAGFTVFSIVGYLSRGVGVENLGISGPYLVFVTYPTAVTLLPAAATVFGVIFYIALLTFGIDSAFSMIEPITSSLDEKLGFSKVKATAMICILGFILSLLFATGSGLYWLEVADYFIANFGLVSIGLMECIVLGWFYPLKHLRKHINKTSEIKIGVWWEVLVKYVIPLVLLLLLTVSMFDAVFHPSFKYHWIIPIMGGILPIMLTMVTSFILMKKNKGILCLSQQ